MGLLLDVAGPDGFEGEGTCEVVWQPVDAEERLLWRAALGGVRAGRREVSWDGFSAPSPGGALDTALLWAPPAEGRLLARARVRCSATGRVEEARLPLRGRPAGPRGGGAWTFAPADFLDLRVDRAARRVDVTLYLRFVRGRTEHPRGVDRGPRMEAVILEGVSRYWSRRGAQAVRLGDERWEVHTRAAVRPHRSQPFTLHVWRGAQVSAVPAALHGWLGEAAREGLGRWSRRLRSPLRFGASNRFPGQRGQLFYWVDRPVPDPDDDLRRTAAHELGHAILYAAEGLEVSATHEGTSGMLQRPRADAPLYPPPPAEIDLMHYFREPASASPNVAGWEDYYARSVASAGDVLRLLSLAVVRFEEAR